MARKSFAIIVQLGKRKLLLKKALGDAATQMPSCGTCMAACPSARNLPGERRPKANFFREKPGSRRGERRRK